MDVEHRQPTIEPLNHRTTTAVISIELCKNKRVTILWQKQKTYQPTTQVTTEWISRESPDRFALWLQSRSGLARQSIIHPRIFQSSVQPRRLQWPQSVIQQFVSVLFVLCSSCERSFRTMPFFSGFRSNSAKRNKNATPVSSSGIGSDYRNGHLDSDNDQRTKPKSKSGSSIKRFFSSASSSSAQAARKKRPEWDEDQHRRTSLARSDTFTLQQQNAKPELRNGRGKDKTGRKSSDGEWVSEGIDLKIATGRHTINETHLVKCQNGSQFRAFGEIVTILLRNTH